MVDTSSLDTIEIVDHPIDYGKLIGEAFSQSSGAIVVFMGTVRRHSRGRDIIYLEYDIYREMAIKELKAIGSNIRERWAVDRLLIVHRSGRLEVGEISILIVVSSPHREEAFAATRFAIESLKKSAPIWKKEVWEGGEEWIKGS